MKPKISELGLLLVSIFISLAAVSALMEFIYIKRHPWEVEFQYIKADEEFGWLPIPGRDIASHPFGKMKINSAGFRSEEIIPGKKKILLLGDSVAFGYGVADNQTLGYFLSQKPDALSYQVVNAAVPGYGTDQEYLRLSKTLQTVSGIKKAVFILFPNDLLDVRLNVLYADRKPFYSINQQTGELVFHPIKRWDLRYWVSQIRFLKKCLMIGERGDKLFAALAGDRFLSEEEGEKIISILLGKIRSLLARHGIETLIVLSPSTKDFPEKTAEFSKLETILKKEKVAHFSLYDDLKKRDIAPLFRDEAHYTAEGNQLVADLLDPLLFQKEKVPDAASL